MLQLHQEINISYVAVHTYQRESLYCGQVTYYHQGHALFLSFPYLCTWQLTMYYVVDKRVNFLLTPVIYVHIVLQGVEKSFIKTHHSVCRLSHHRSY